MAGGAGPRPDVLVRGGTVLDGSGGPPIDADIAISDGRVSAILERGEEPPATATVIDASGLVVAPGFIDIHTHSDVSLLLDGRGQSKVLQGVTTDVVGNCGFSAFPIDPTRIDLHRDHLARLGDEPITPTWTDLDGYAQAMEAGGIAMNLAPLVGHGTLRVAAMGMSARAPTRAELERMTRLAIEASEQGAFGLSTGLTHVPSAYASADEVAELAAVMAARQRVYATHARARAGWTLKAIDEAVEVGRSTGVPVQFSHLAINEPALWGRADAVLERFEAARDEGVDIAFDVYPYDASSSSLTQYLPGWLQEGGSAAMSERLADGAVRRRALEEIASGWWGGIPWHWDRVRVSRAEAGDQQLVGRTLADIAARLGRRPEVVMLELCETYGNEVEVVLFYRTEVDMLTFLRHPYAVVGSDGSALPLDQGGDRPHPRSFGTFPRILGRYVRQGRALSLPTAIAKMTSAVADRMGIVERGRIAPGQHADIVMFDAEAVRDTATFEEPCRAPLGIMHVLVSGVAVVRDGRQTEARPGSILRASA